MKFGKILLAAVAAITFTVATTAQAQIGFDAIKAMRAGVISTSQKLIEGSNNTTNGPFDLTGLTGWGKIDFVLTTNSVATAVTANIYSSDDQSTLSAATGMVYITGPTTINLTNFANATAVTTNGSLPGTTISYLTNFTTAANSMLLPFTVTLPTAASAGFATGYPAWLLATNAGPDSLKGNSVTEIGFNVKDLHRYLYVVYSPSGTVTNAIVSAIVTAPNISSPTTSGAY